MGQRRGSGRTGANYSLGGHHTKKLSFSQTSSGRPHRSGPLRHSSPHSNSYPPRRVSLSSDSSCGSSSSSNRMCLHKREKLSSSPTHEVDRNSLWSDSSHSSCSMNTNCPSSGSESGASSTHCSKKSDRPTAARPSNPLRYKTELCRSYEEGGVCRFGSTCTFAHGLRELRAVPRHPRYKTDPCRTYHTLGYCQYGARCHFVHDPEEAAGVSPMRGHKLHLRQDRLSATIMAMAEQAGVSSEPATSRVFLDNLLNLHAVRTLKDQEQKAGELLTDAALVESNLDLGININSDSSCTFLESISGINLSDSFTSTSIFDTSLDYIKDSAFDQDTTDVKFDKSFDTGIFSTSMSVSPPGDAWWGTWNGMLTPPLSPNSDSGAVQKPGDVQKPPEDAQNSSVSHTVLNVQNSLEVRKPSIAAKEHFGVSLKSSESTPNHSAGQTPFDALRKLFEAPQKPFPSMYDMREVVNSMAAPVIANPMDMSRSLMLPNIMDLCHTS